jgi:hypothetical protein
VLERTVILGRKSLFTPCSPRMFARRKYVSKRDSVTSALVCRAVDRYEVITIAVFIIYRGTLIRAVKPERDLWRRIKSFGSPAAQSGASSE